MSRDWTRSEDVDHGTSIGAPQGIPGKRTRSGKIQRRAAGGAEPASQRANASDVDALGRGAADALVAMGGGGGAALPAGVRSQFEGSLGADLGGVRVHTGGESAAAAESLNAQAFTVGNDIHFGAGRFQPDDPFGLHLLAHEVAHTQQQAGGSAGAQLKGLDVSTPGDASEVEADRAADAMVRGEAAAVTGAGPSVQRFFGLWDDEGVEDGAGADPAKYAAAPVDKPRPKYLLHAESNQPFGWDELQPEAKGKKRLTAKIIQDWIDFYGLAVRSYTPIHDDPKACEFNLHLSTVNSVVSMFMKDSKLANFIDDPYGAYELIHRDQQAKAKAAAQKKIDDKDKDHGNGKPGPQYWPGKEPVEDDKKPKAEPHHHHLEIEWEFTPAKAKLGWDGKAEVEGPEHEFKGQLKAWTREIGSWKAEVSGAGIVKFKGAHLEEVGYEAESKMEGKLFNKIAVELVGKVLVANSADVKHGNPIGRLLRSNTLKVEPSGELNVFYEVPGLGGKVKVKGGVSADPDGVGVGASLSVSWD